MTNPSNELFEAANKAASQFRAMHDAMRGPQQAALDDFNVELNKFQCLVRHLGVKSLPPDVVGALRSVTERLHSAAARLELNLLERQQKERDRESKEFATRAATLRKELP